MRDLTPRERTLRTIRHEAVDRMPITLDVGASAGIDSTYIDIFQDATGETDPPLYFDYDVRYVDAPLIPTGSDFEQFYETVPPGTKFDGFGVGHVPLADFPLGMDIHPWARFTTKGEMESYPFPRFEVTDEMIAEIASLHDRGYAVSVASGSINEWCYYLRGMDAFFMDLPLYPELARTLLERVTELCIDMGVKLAGAGVDIVCFYGDMGSQSSLLMSPEMWHEWIRPRWQRIVDAVRGTGSDVAIFYHSCGAIEPIIPGLIDIGFDILNPVQPESMDPVRIKQRYGSEICLWGGIGMQSTMLDGSVDEVRRAASSLVDAWSPGSGAIVTVAQTMLKDVPFENVVSLVETVRERSARVGHR